MSSAATPDVIPDPLREEFLREHQRISEQMLNFPFVESEGSPSDSPWHRDCINLLIDSTLSWFQDRTDFYVGGNMFVYFSLEQSMNRDYKGPDFFFVNGRPLRPQRKYWVTWLEGGRLPNMIVELLSPTTEREDRTTKFTLYEQTFQTRDYFCYDPFRRALDGWRFNSVTNRYEPLVPNEHGRLWSRKWACGWAPGKANSCATGPPGCFYDPDGNLVLTRGERAEQQEAAERQARRPSASARTPTPACRRGRGGAGPATRPAQATGGQRRPARLILPHSPSSRPCRPLQSAEFSPGLPTYRAAPGGTSALSAIARNVLMTSTAPQRTFLGHPIGLYVLFFTEMWERFSYYGMRALLILYMVNYFKWLQRDASLIYKWYTSLVYLTPLLGGYLADRYLGNKRAVLIGAVLMAIGHFLMAFEAAAKSSTPLWSSSSSATASSSRTCPRRSAGSTRPTTRAATGPTRSFTWASTSAHSCRRSCAAGWRPTPSAGTTPASPSPASAWCSACSSTSSASAGSSNWIRQARRRVRPGAGSEAQAERRRPPRPRLRQSCRAEAMLLALGLGLVVGVVLVAAAAAGRGAIRPESAC